MLKYMELVPLVMDLLPLFIIILLKTTFLLKALVQTIEHELEVTVGVHEVRSEYERQMKE